MVQKINTYFPQMVAQTPGQPTDAIGVIIRPDFNLHHALYLEQQGSWGVNNPPLFVDQVYYGRILVVTVDQNEYTTDLYNQLKASDTASVGFSTTCTKLFQDPSIKLFSMGPFSEVDLTQLTSGSWKSFFEHVPAEGPSFDHDHKPIGFKLRDWMLRPVKISNQVKYNTHTC